MFRQKPAQIHYLTYNLQVDPARPIHEETWCDLQSAKRKCLTRMTKCKQKRLEYLLNIMLLKSNSISI